MQIDQNFWKPTKIGFSVGKTSLLVKKHSLPTEKNGFSLGLNKSFFGFEFTNCSFFSGLPIPLSTGF